MTKGIFLISFGKRGYHYAAYNLAYSIKHYNPEIQIAILHDEAFNSWLNESQREVFDIKIEIPQHLKNYDSGKLDAAGIKISMYDFLPFDENLYLDVDAVALQDISPIFDEIGNEDFYTHVFDTHTIAQGREIPSMIWAWADDIWEKYKLSNDAILPCTNSSFQFIRKGEKAKQLFDQIKKNYADPIPLNKLRTAWGGHGQPDELYLNIAMAQLGISGKSEKEFMFLANRIRPENTNQLKEMFYIMSMFGNKDFIRPKYKDWYDNMLIVMFRKDGRNHNYKFNNYIASDKVANTKAVVPKQVARLPRTLTAKHAEKINLYLSYYSDPKIERREEIIQAIKKNIACKEIEKIFLVTESKFPCPVESDKIVFITQEARVTYNDLFKIANHNATENTISIIQNADIYHDDANLNLIKEIDFSGRCLALSRWEAVGKLKHFNYEYSQDSWVFKGQIKPVDGDIILGIPGCDNRIAFELAKQYQVVNPSVDIKTFHLHASVRNYTEADRVEGDYKPVKPESSSPYLKKRMLINQPGKVGDIIICLPIAKYYSDKFVVDWLCPEKYHSLFQYVDYVTPVKSETIKYDKVIDLSFGLSKGSVENWWLANRNRFDSFVIAKYELAGVDVNEKKNLIWTRNEKQEDELFNDVVTSADYALVHDTSDHGTPPVIEPELPVVYFKPVKDFSIFDWYKVILNAKEIHCIDSSLLNFVDVISTDAKLFYYRTDRAANKWNETIVSDKWMVKDQLQEA